ncbi:MAG: hypothetical protein HKP40_10285 [Litoreibacter sp.]|nr:hypothetical protein [Litoreibacter sp.]
MTADIYYHRRRTLVTVIALLTAPLALLVFAMLFGEGFDPTSSDPFWGLLLVFLLLIPIAGFC